MSAVYVQSGTFSDAPEITRELALSIGTLEKPLVAHFKKESDLIAYMYGNEPTINDQKLKERHKFLHQQIEAQI